MIVAILAVGIGANTAIFAQIDAVAWTRLPVRTPEELRSIAWMSASPDQPRVTAFQESFAYPEYESMRSGSTSFAEMACWAPSNLNRPVIAPEIGRIDAQDVSGNFFRMAVVAPILGRVLPPEDDREDAAEPVMDSSGKTTISARSEITRSMNFM